MKLFGREIEGRAKVLTILAAVLLIASGLCGAQSVILDSRRNGLDELMLIFAVTGIVELGLMLLAVVGILIVLVQWSISALFRRSKTREEDE